MWDFCCPHENARFAFNEFLTTIPVFNHLAAPKFTCSCERMTVWNIKKVLRNRKKLLSIESKGLNSDSRRANTGILPLFSHPFQTHTHSLHLIFTRLHFVMSLFASVVPHFLKNDPSWALNQTSSPTHTHRGMHTLVSQTHAQIRITRMTDGVQGQRCRVCHMCDRFTICSRNL